MQSSRERLTHLRKGEKAKCQAARYLVGEGEGRQELGHVGFIDNAQAFAR